MRLGSRITAAATTGPANGPLPASSHPATGATPRFMARRSRAKVGRTGSSSSGRRGAAAALRLTIAILGCDSCRHVAHGPAEGNRHGAPSSQPRNPGHVSAVFRPATAETAARLGDKMVKPGDIAARFDAASRAIFAIAAGILMLLAVVLAIDALAQFVLALWSGSSAGIPALTGIGYVVVAIAVFDVAKYLIEEEVVRGREMRVASETRKSLTRFISTIAIAIFLEALVTVFRVSQDDVTNLVYPTMLFVAAILLVVGLGVYQRLSAEVEQQVGHHDRADDAKKAK